MRDQLRIISNNETVLGSQNHAIIPPCDTGQTKVTPSCDPGVTAITPPHTTVTPPTHTNLSQKQAHVFEYLERNISRQTSYNTIGTALGLSKSAARDAVLGLVSKKYISNIATIRDGVFQGFAYRIDGQKCQHFLEAGGAANPRYLSSNYTVTPPPHTVSPHSDHSHTHSSRVCNLETKLTTNTVDLGEPELVWWVDQGLKKNQIKTWLDEFLINPEELAQSLRFARYDIAVNEIKPKGMPVSNPFNYFYKMVMKSGMYPRPQNYKSFLELRADELEKQQRRDEIAREKIRKYEFDVKFKEFMCDHDSPLYRELLGHVGEFAKDAPFALEIEMKELFREKYHNGRHDRS